MPKTPMFSPKPPIKSALVPAILLAGIVLLCQQFAYANTAIQTATFQPTTFQIVTFQPATVQTAKFQPATDQAQNDTLPVTCAKTPEIEKIIDDAIALGAPIYNEGLHIACYRIYEWAAYKILYEYGKTCKEVEKILKTAIDKSHGDYSDTEKAWLMRAAFDKIMGVPTRTGESDKATLPRNG